MFAINERMVLNKWRVRSHVEAIHDPNDQEFGGVSHRWLIVEGGNMDALLSRDGNSVRQGFSKRVGVAF